MHGPAHIVYGHVALGSGNAHGLVAGLGQEFGSVECGQGHALVAQGLALVEVEAELGLSHVRLLSARILRSVLNIHDGLFSL